MRKRIFSAFLALALCLLLPFPAQAAPEEAQEGVPEEAQEGALETAYNAETGILTVTLPTAPAGDALLLAAAYEATGRMAGVSIRELRAGDEAAQTFDDLPEAARYKAFLLDSGAEEAEPLGPPLVSAGAGAVNYGAMVTAQGRVFVPAIDGAVAHSTAMAVDAYVEAGTAKDKVLPLFQNTGSSVTEDGKSVPVNRLAELVKSGSEAEKKKALVQIRNAMAAMEHSVRASAVLDAAAEQDLAQTMASLQEEALQVRLLSASDKQAEAVKWAEELSAKWDALPKKERLRNFAQQMGVDARTAYQALADAQDILNGKYTDDAKFYDICTKVAIGVKTAAKVGVFVCATAATGGAAAAGTLTAAQATGFVVGGVDCCVEVARTEAKILLGDDHELVQKMENSTAAKVYDTAMFLYGVATFDPKNVSTGEKLLFVEDLAEKNIDAYQNVQVCIDEATGLVIDRIEGETKKIAVDYTRIQSTDKADLAPAAEKALGADKTGILGIDPSLNDGTVAQQKQAFTQAADSSDTALAKTYAQVKDGDKPLSEKAAEFKQECDKQVSYKSVKSSGGGEDGGDGGDGGGGGGGPGGGGGGGGSGGPNLPTPSMDYDTVKEEQQGDHSACDNYYKDGQLVGQVSYVIDENGRYWITSEEWLCDNGDWLITEYYQKNQVLRFEWYAGSEGGTEEVMAKNYGAIYRRYGRHVTRDESSSFVGYSNVWYDDMRWYPTGQLYQWSKRMEGKELEFIQYSPEGRLYCYETDWDEDLGLFLYEYEYFVYPSKHQDVPFDPTGHIFYMRHRHATTEYHIVHWSEGESSYWGYYVYHGDNNGLDWNNPDKIVVTAG